MYLLIMRQFIFAGVDLSEVLEELERYECTPSDFQVSIQNLEGAEVFLQHVQIA